jgi:Domain of unknown function (DUF4365)
VQLKSSDSPQKSSDGKHIKFDLNIRDLELWLSGREVMILVIYDAIEEKSFFVELAKLFFKKLKIFGEYT